MSLKKGTTTISGLGGDGFSPIAIVSKSGVTTTITITDRNGTTTSQIVDENIQYSTMPTAGADTVGKLVQYTGTTDSNYTNGYFYKGISTTEGNETTYSWEKINVQDNIILDSTPTQNSTNGVTSGGVYNALAGISGGQEYTVLNNWESSFNIRTRPAGIYLFNQVSTGNFKIYRTINNTDYMQVDMTKGWILIMNIYKDVDWDTPASGNEYYGYFDYWNRDSGNVIRYFIYRNGTSQVAMNSASYIMTNVAVTSSSMGINATWNFNALPTVANWLTVNYSNQLVPRSYVDNYIAPNYNSNNTYNVGDLVLHDTNLYQCNTAITTPEAWNSSKWTKITLADTLNSGGVAGDTLKIGAIIPYTGTTAPNGYMICDGTAISRTTYAELFSVIGTTFGAGDGSTTFNIPNLKGKIPVGLDGEDEDFDTLGETGGSKDLQEHTHKFGYMCSGVSAGGSAPYEVGKQMGHSPDNLYTETSATGTGNSGNLQPYIVINYIIKVTEAQTGEVLSETLPVGTELDYDGDTVPSGWEEIDNPEEYSTTETLTNKTWIDDKIIYRKVFNGNLSNDSNTQTVTHGISNIGTVTSISGTIFDGSSGQYWSALCYSSTDWCNVRFDNTNMYLNHGGSNLNGKVYKVIVEYTKTTD